jgi:hypothetical protein
LCRDTRDDAEADNEHFDGKTTEYEVEEPRAKSMSNKGPLGESTPEHRCRVRLRKYPQPKAAESAKQKNESASNQGFACAGL